MISACEPGMYYAVMSRRTAKIVYLGRNLADAAAHLVPGTVYGKSQDPKQAQANAFLQAALASK
jgi:hypothetical protein